MVKYPTEGHSGSCLMCVLTSTLFTQLLEFSTAVSYHIKYVMLTIAPFDECCLYGIEKKFI